jgi:hypothetical protein
MGSEALEGPREVEFAPYVRLAASGNERLLGGWEILSTDWTEIGFTLPSTDEAIDEIGLRLVHRGAERVLMYLRVRRFEVAGAGRTLINPPREAEEWGSVSRFSFNRGRWGLAGGRITGSTESDADLWTGHPNARDQRVTAEVEALSGESHLVTVRAAGARRFYAAGIESGRAVIRAEEFGDTLLAEAPVTPPAGPVELCFEARGDSLSLRVDGVEVLAATDARHPRGMAGLRMGAPGEIACSRFEIEEF